MINVQIGSSNPAFILPDQNGNVFNINSVLGRKNLVIYFYPVFNSQTQATKHVDEALRILKGLQ